jgi:hypothetical protein
MNCEQCRENLFCHIEGLLSEEQEQDLQEHLNTCDHCDLEASEMTALHGRLVSDGTAYAESGLEDKVIDRIIREQTHELRRLKKTNTQLQVWRRVINSKITQYAAAAIVVAAVVLSITVMDKTTPMAMADILEAMHSVRYIHFKVFQADAEVPDEAWVEFDTFGNVQNIRMQIYSQTEGAAEGLKVAVWKEGKAKVWIEEKNVLMEVPEQDVADQILNTVTKLDPKHAIQNMYEGQQKGDLILNIKEPANKIDPVIIDAEVPAENIMLVLSIDPATKLLTSFKRYALKDGEYQYERLIEYHDYNQPIDPAMFILDDEVPDDVIMIDRPTGPVGLEQGQLSPEQIAVKVVREFFEAMIAKDYARAGFLLGGIPAEKMEQLYGHLNVLEIVSIGEASTTSVDQLLKVPCVLKVLEDGEITEWSPYGPFVRQVPDQPGRWVIMGGM